jgi:lipopolysaccharide/colanic/teichoic acid biosynthesis glycosyltransferase
MSAEAWTEQRRAWTNRRIASGRHRGFGPSDAALPPIGFVTGPASDDQPVVVFDGRHAASSSAARHAARPALAIQSRPGRAAKRVLDLVVALPVLVLFLVTLPFIALALKLSSPGPILFKQQRIGRDGRPITVYKFRSMRIDAEARLRADPELFEAYLQNGFKVPSQIDPRITRVGRFLRKSSLDELPQSICVLRGTMSAVGPRPVVPDELAALYHRAPEYYLACKPGLTGLWQVSGRSNVLHKSRSTLDELYATNWSLLWDVKILVRTVPAVLTAHGAH